MLFQVSLKSVTCKVSAVLYLFFSHTFLCLDMLTESGIGGHGTTGQNRLQNAAVASEQAIKKTERGSYGCPVDAFFFKPTLLCIKLHYK